MKKRAAIVVNRHGVTAHELNGVALIGYPGGDSQQYKTVASVQEAVDYLENQGYTVTVHDHLFDTGRYVVVREHVAGVAGLSCGLHKIKA